MRRYLTNLLLWVDQGGNVLLGGHPDETISSRVGRGAIKGNRFALLAERVIDWIFWRLAGEVGHCRASIEGWRK